MKKDRLEFLKQQALNWSINQKPYVGQRLYYALESLAQTKGHQPWMMRNALMLANIIKGTKPIIHPQELLVGYNYYGSDHGQWMEVWLTPRSGEEEEALQQYLSEGELTQDQVEFVMGCFDRMPGIINLPAFVVNKPRSVIEAEQDGVIAAGGTPLNHTVINYKKVLEEGFSGIAAEIRGRINRLDLSDPLAPQKTLLLESCLIVAEAGCLLGRKYARRAQELLDNHPEKMRGKELDTILRTVGQVPEFPARDFREAIQSLWFAHIINTWEDGINANSLGRIDQILYPYYEQDLKAGTLTREEALELICCLWLKLYRDYDVQQVTLGGVDEKGNDATNELTFLMLEATEMLDLIRCLGVRLHHGSPQHLIRRSLELLRLGKGIPFFFNDDTLVPALVDKGITIDDARDYANIGCVETTIPGKANPHAVSNRINLLKCLELALNNGVSLTTGRQIGPQTGLVETFRNIEDVIRAYQAQVAYFTKLACFESNRCEQVNSLVFPLPYKSMLTTGCLENGRDFNAGGAVYNFHESMAMGIPNVADSLAALEEIVYRQEKYSLVDIVKQMRGNFEEELIRKELIEIPAKYGNDIDQVDRFAIMAFEHFCKTLNQHHSQWGQGFFAQPFTFLWHLDMGAQTGATPDGRRKGEIFAYSLSPMQGRDRAGLTAVLNSLAKLPHHLAAGSTSAIIEIDPQLFEPENLHLMIAFLQTAIQKGVGQLQINVVTADTLLKAKSEPEKYQNLAVRVSGFSQRFCLLDERLQDHIIARTKHTGG